MNHLHALLFLAPVAGLALPPLAQQTAPPGLIRIQPFATNHEPFDADAWRAKLSSTDLDRREQDFADLAQRVRRDPAARSEVEEWARSGDGELAWTARLILRESDRRSGLGLGGAVAGTHSLWLQHPDELEDLFGRLPLSLHQLGDDSLLAPSVPAVPPSSTPQGGTSSSRSQQFELRSGPDGVHVTVVEGEDGKTEQKEYSAESLEKLLEEHPELADRIGGPLGGRAGAPSAWVAPGGTNPGMQFFFGERGAPVAKVRTDMLGVSVRPLPKNEAKALGVDAGLGLLVERVEPGSLAAALGIQRGHVLVGLNAHELHTAQDITDQLCARPADGEVRIELIDRWGQRRTRTWKPEPQEDAPTPGDDSKTPAAPSVKAPRELRKI